MSEDRAESRALLRQAHQIHGLITSDAILEYLSREARRVAGAAVACASCVQPGQSWQHGSHVSASGAELGAPAPAAMVSAAFAAFRRLSANAEPLCLAQTAESGALFRGFGAGDAPGASLWVVPLHNGRKRLVGQVAVLLERPAAGSPAWMNPLLDLVALASLALESAQRLAFARRDQERLLLLAAATDEALWDWDLTSNAFWWGGGIHSLLQSSAEAIGSAAAWKFTRIHPDDAPDVEGSLQAALRGRDSIWRASYRFRRGNDSWAVVEDRGYFLRDVSGRPYRMFGAMKDVTAERWIDLRQEFLIKASSALAASLQVEKNVEGVAGLASKTIADYCVVLLLGADGVPSVTVGHRDEARAARIAAALEPVAAREREAIARGLARSRLVKVTPGWSRRLVEAIPGLEDRRAIEALVAELEPAFILQAPLLTSGGVGGCIALVAARGSGIHYSETDLAFVEELARRCDVAIDKARLYEEAQNSIRSRDAFMAILGHELRNPLAPITTALHLMKLRDPRGQREQEVIARQVNHLTRLVDDLLDISRIERGKIEISKRPIHLAEVVAKAVEMTSPLLEQRRHRLDIDVPRVGLSLLADETRLAQVVSNLLTNAARYTDEGGHISVRAFRDGRQVVLSVADDGIGMPAELIPRLFEPFSQGPRTLDRRQGGLGLGLSLVRSLVTLHGGTVEARSAGLGKGSEFIVRLPAAAVELVEGPPASAFRAEARPLAVRRRVLIVDDNVDAAELLCEVLRVRGHVVSMAHDGPTALSLAPTFEPDIAVLDIGLPVMDGYELASRLPSLLARRPLLVALTGYAQDRDRSRAREAGFDEHLTKPVEPGALLLLIEGDAVGVASAELE